MSKYTFDDTYRKDTFQGFGRFLEESVQIREAALNKVMIYLFTPYRFNEVENRNGHSQADEQSKTAFSDVE